MGSDVWAITVGTCVERHAFQAPAVPALSPSLISPRLPSPHTFMSGLLLCIHRCNDTSDLAKRTSIMT